MKEIIRKSSAKLRGIGKNRNLNLVLAGMFLVVAIIFVIESSHMGKNLGMATGSAAGKAVGSLRGMTQGQIEGSAAGKAEGLSAKDTEAEVLEDLQQVENLEVLVASVKLSDFHTIGDEDSPSYAALYLVNGNVVFTVDMSQAGISVQSDGLHIRLPEPIGSLYVDDSTIEKLTEYQRKLFNGSAEDGFDAYLNTMARVQTATAEVLNNYDMLIRSAKSAAENQVKLLAESASVSDEPVIIEWAD